MAELLSGIVFLYRATMNVRVNDAVVHDVVCICSDTTLQKWRDCRPTHSAKTASIATSCCVKRYTVTALVVR